MGDEQEFISQLTLNNVTCAPGVQSKAMKLTEPAPVTIPSTVSFAA
jgi:hypothetical protein